MAALTLEMAEKAVKAAQAKARELGTPMTATVVDEAGRLCCLLAATAPVFLLLKLPAPKLSPQRLFDARPKKWCG